MKNFFYHCSLWLSSMSECLTTVHHLYPSRWAYLHEVHKIMICKADMLKKTPAIYLAVGKYHRLLASKPREEQQEIGHVFLFAKTRRGKSLNCETNGLTW